LIFFCLETKIQDLETFAKNLNLILKFPKLARVQNWFFGSIFMSRFKQWEFFNGISFNFFNAPFSYVDFKEIN